MCFLKLGDPLAPCDHEECKKTLQAIQMSSCLYNSSNKPNQMIFKPQPQYVPKRSRPDNLMESVNNSEENLIKKIKTDVVPNEENEKKEDNSNTNPQNNEECLMKLLAMQQNKPMQNSMPHNFINMKGNLPSQNMMSQQQNNDNQLLTFLLMQNNNNKNLNNMPVYHDVNQNLQDPMLNLQLQMNAFHNNNGNIYENNHMNNQNNVLLSKDFLNKIYSIITMQHKLITEIKDKNNQLFDGFNKLSQEFIEFKTYIIKATQDETKPEPVAIQPKLDLLKSKSILSQPLAISHQFNIIGVPGETITARDLLHYLYAHKQEKFQFKLTQSSELDSTLYRERNFSFSVSLVDLNDQPLANTNRIPLSVAIYTYENPPKCLDTNTAGSKILKGNIEKDLVNGYCSFEKIQIKEVTSHFRKGYVFLVIYPKMPTFGNISSGTIQQNFVDFTTIKPLIIEKVVVKAKKINLCKNMDQSSQNQNNGETENCLCDIKDEEESDDGILKEKCSNAE